MPPVPRRALTMACVSHRTRLQILADTKERTMQPLKVMKQFKKGVVPDKTITLEERLGRKARVQA